MHLACQMVKPTGFFFSKLLSFLSDCFSYKNNDVVEANALIQDILPSSYVTKLRCIAFLDSPFYSPLMHLCLKRMDNISTLQCLIIFLFLYMDRFSLVHL